MYDFYFLDQTKKSPHSLFKESKKGVMSLKDTITAMTPNTKVATMIAFENSECASWPNEVKP